MACAGITLPNPASVALHERLGFVQSGVGRAVGWKLGAWRDVGYYQLELAPAPAGPPPDPLPPEHAPTAEVRSTRGGETRAAVASGHA